MSEEDTTREQPQTGDHRDEGARTTLQALLANELEHRDETPDDLSVIVVGSNSNEYKTHETKQVGFDDLSQWDGHFKYGSQELPGIRAWSKSFVYFKHEYDGWETVESVHRHPSDEETGAIR